MHMAGLLTAAAAVLACATPSAGSRIMQMRYPGYYAHYDDGFDSNSAARTEPGQRIGAFAPSNAERALVDTINFDKATRKDETRVFHGRMHVPRCRQGEYLFRITSSVSAHLFVNGGLIFSNQDAIEAETHTVSVYMKTSKYYDFELWWGNWGGDSELKVEWAYNDASAASFMEDLALEWKVLDSLAVAGAGEEEQEAEVEDNSELRANVLTAKQLAKLDDNDLDWSADLSGVFEKQDMPTVKRCDYQGYFKDNIHFFSQDKLTSKFQPGGCSEEVGGVISMNTGPLGNEDSTDTSFKFEATLTPRTTGLHTFWLQADDGAHLYVQPKGSKNRHVIDNGGWHAPTWQHGSLFLVEGQAATMKVYYGNAGATGILKLLWEDPLAHGPQESFLPLLSK